MKLFYGTARTKVLGEIIEFWNIYITGIHGIRLYHVSWVIYPSTLECR